MELQDLKKDVLKALGGGDPREKIEEILKLLEEQRHLIRDILVDLGERETAFGKTRSELIETLDEATGLKMQTEEYLNRSECLSPKSEEQKEDLIKFTDHSRKEPVIVTSFDGFFIKWFVELRSIGICRMEVIGLNQHKFSYEASYLYDFNPRSPLLERFRKDYSEYFDKNRQHDSKETSEGLPIEIIHLYTWNLYKSFITIEKEIGKPATFLNF